MATFLTQAVRYSALKNLDGCMDTAEYDVSIQSCHTIKSTFA